MHVEVFAELSRDAGSIPAASTTYRLRRKVEEAGIGRWARGFPSRAFGINSSRRLHHLSLKAKSGRSRNWSMGARVSLTCVRDKLFPPPPPFFTLGKNGDPEKRSDEGSSKNVQRDHACANTTLVCLSAEMRRQHLLHRHHPRYRTTREGPSIGRGLRLYPTAVACRIGLHRAAWIEIRSPQTRDANQEVGTTKEARTGRAERGFPSRSFGINSSRRLHLSHMPARCYAVCRTRSLSITVPFALHFRGFFRFAPIVRRYF